MNPKVFIKRAVYFSLAGTLFAGYLSGVKLVSGTCALNEPCPYFLGYPACYFGFFMFASMFVISFWAQKKQKYEQNIINSIGYISLLGILFAGYFVAQEALAVIRSKELVLYGLGLPTCVYGLIFYIIIFVMFTKTKKTPPQESPQS